MNDVALVFRRELSAQTRTKGFAIGLVALVVIVVAAVVAPKLLGDSGSRHRLGLVGSASQALAPAISGQADAAGVGIELTGVPDEQTAEAKLAAGDLDAVLLDGSVVLASGVADQGLRSVIDGARQLEVLRGNLSSLGLSPGEIEGAVSIPGVEVRSVGGADGYEGARSAIAILVMLSLLYLFMTAPVGLAAGLVEEKSSRIVEILLVAVRPWQLLTGKLFAFGVVGLIQLAAMAVAGVITAAATGMLADLPPGLGGMLALTVSSYLLGFLFFGSMAIALASLVSRQEETNGALAPMTVAVIVSYLVGFLAPELTGFWSVVVPVLPPVSTIALPVQLAAGQVSTWQLIVGPLLMIVAIAALVMLAGRIYQRSVLRVGGRIKLTAALAGER